MSSVCCGESPSSPIPPSPSLLHRLPSLSPGTLILTPFSPELHPGTLRHLGPYLLIKAQPGPLQRGIYLLGVTQKWICFPPISWEIELDL